ncbi:MAG: hypothetical protein U1C04_11215 [Hydrogenophaga sp.]|uniref:hypothetical protein n=1 Tax=Hydrogenophaga sp. TaxID=1904254 RepID=UPI002ABAC0AD|nr:hypothetical protein [Hydrogenophaga sp.]MDZ4281328.1 hypothetical protein [Hydrogenophaga sp.]
MKLSTFDSASSIEKLYSLLGDIQAHPAKYSEDHDLMRTLTAQGRLANYKKSEIGIAGMSLNTQKLLADRAIPGGYAALDAARVAAKAALQRYESVTTVPKAGTKTLLLARVKKLEGELLRLEGDLLVVSDLLERCMRQARTYADSAPQTTRDRCGKEQAEILAMLGPRAKPRLRVIK